MSSALAGSARVKRNVVSNIISQLLSWAVSFTVVIFLPAYVGAAGLGKLSFAGAFSILLLAVIPLGASTVLVKEIARDRSRVMELLAAALTLRIPLAVIGGAVAFGAVHIPALTIDSQTRFLVLINVLVTLVSTINEAFMAALQGLERMPRQNAAALVEKYCWAFLILGMIFLHAALWQIAAAGIVSNLVSIIVNVTAFRGEWSKFRFPTPQQLWSLAHAGLPFMGWTIFTTLYGQSDPLIMRLVVTDNKSIGYYAIASKLIQATMFFVTAISMALIPALSRLYKEEQDLIGSSSLGRTGSSSEFEKLAARAFSLTALCGIPISFVLMFGASSVLAIMPFRHGFEGAVPVLRIGGVGVLLWYTGIILGTMVVSRDDQKKMLKASIGAACIGIPLCAALSYATYHKWGNAAIGAVTSDAIVELYLIACYIRMLPNALYRGISWSYIARCCVASMPMVAFVIWISRIFDKLWILLPAIIIYGISCYILGCLRRSDIMGLKSMITKT